MNIDREIAALAKMTAKQLRRRHVELFGEEARSGNRRWLFRRIAWRMQALHEGDLSERARRRAMELARDADLRIRPPNGPIRRPAAFEAARRLPINRDPRLPMPGAVLTRVFKGHEYHVTVLPDGFEYDGEGYRSLTAVAHAITGSHWNGYHFFDIKSPSS